MNRLADSFSKIYDNQSNTRHSLLDINGFKQIWMWLTESTFLFQSWSVAGATDVFFQSWLVPGAIDVLFQFWSVTGATSVLFQSWSAAGATDVLFNKLGWSWVKGPCSNQSVRRCELFKTYQRSFFILIQWCHLQTIWWSYTCMNNNNTFIFCQWMMTTFHISHLVFVFFEFNDRLEIISILSTAPKIWLFSNKEKAIC